MQWGGNTCSCDHRKCSISWLLLLSLHSLCFFVLANTLAQFSHSILHSWLNDKFITFQRFPYAFDNSFAPMEGQIPFCYTNMKSKNVLSKWAKGCQANIHRTKTLVCSSLTIQGTGRSTHQEANSAQRDERWCWMKHLLPMQIQSNSLQHQESPPVTKDKYIRGVTKLGKGVCNMHNG